MEIKISSTELDKIVADHCRAKLGIKNKLRVSYHEEGGDSPYELAGVVVTVEVPNKVVK